MSFRKIISFTAAMIIAAANIPFLAVTPYFTASAETTEQTETNKLFIQNTDQLKKYIGFEEGQKELVVPETVTVDGKEYTITDVNSECYTELGIEAVTIPKSFKTVSDSTFRNCQYLIKSVTISDGITEIDDHTFFRFLIS